VNWRTAKPLEVINFEGEPPLTVHQWLAAARELLESGVRPVAMFSRTSDIGVRVWIAFAAPLSGEIYLTSTVFVGEDQRAYSALSIDFACMNYFECELYEQTGIEPLQHPWLRPVRTADPWRKNDGSYLFYRVEGEEVHEVAVGPVHAGVIEPGHFRFQCHGEEILHLEIRLGYQYRNVEEILPRLKRTQQIVLVESIAGDSVIAHATAFCSAIETLAGVSAPLRDQAVRSIAAEMERVAMHLSTLSGIATDISFALPSAAFGALRTAVINLTAAICGNRFGRGWIVPGGVRFDLDQALVEQTRRVLTEVLAKFADVAALFLDAQSTLGRLEGIGVVTTSQARLAGLVGLAARASGVAYDVRADFPYGAYRYSSIASPTLETGDVYARTRLRALEIHNSVRFILEQLDHLPVPKPRPALAKLAKNAFTVALTEGHRGEIAHVLFTDAEGQLARAKIKDSSFHNWHGLALAVRENGISDFPLCNKSFDLSYAGHDL
jgi:Ni,Fe-hydrogenase III large subunit